jgi:hypothetical protein
MPAEFILAAVALCTAIPDADLRAYCRAREAGESAFCNSIADADLRSTCRARFAETPAFARQSPTRPSAPNVEHARCS